MHLPAEGISKYHHTLSLFLMQAGNAHHVEKPEMVGPAAA